MENIVQSVIIRKKCWKHGGKSLKYRVLRGIVGVEKGFTNGIIQNFSKNYTLGS